MSVVLPLDSSPWLIFRKSVRPCLLGSTTSFLLPVWALLEFRSRVRVMWLMSAVDFPSRKTIMSPFPTWPDRGDAGCMYDTTGISMLISINRGRFAGVSRMIGCIVGDVLIPASGEPAFSSFMIEISNEPPSEPDSFSLKDTETTSGLFESTTWFFSRVVNIAELRLSPTLPGPGSMGCAFNALSSAKTSATCADAYDVGGVIEISSKSARSQLSTFGRESEWPPPKPIELRRIMAWLPSTLTEALKRSSTTPPLSLGREWPTEPDRLPASSPVKRRRSTFHSCPKLAGGMACHCCCSSA
mmetsp:Transcript_11972/g.28088  ORF Transcript_11972/g.28088 Transcript_11972/m.28088 type:complete len:300 (-) Transcript_11972:6-905(-)